MNYKLFLFFLCIIQTTASFCQNQYSTDSSVKVFPHWKKGDSHTIKIKSTTEVSNNGHPNSYASEFEAAFKILEKDTSGYTIEWIYKKSALAYDDAAMENTILSGLTNTKIMYKLSLTGRFKELLNYEDIKLALDNSIAKLTDDKSITEKVKNQLAASKEILSTKKGVEVGLLKQIKLYNLSFGFVYRKNYVQTNIITYPNPLGGPSFNATEKVKLISLDNPNSLCEIETFKKVDGEILKGSVVDYLKRTFKKDEKTIDNDLKDSKLEFSDYTFQKLDFNKGLPLQTKVIRTVYFGFENRKVTLEMETVE